MLSMVIMNPHVQRQWILILLLIVKLFTSGPSISASQKISISSLFLPDPFFFLYTIPSSGAERINGRGFVAVLRCRLAGSLTYLDNIVMRNVYSNLTPVARYCNNPINNLYSSLPVLSSSSVTGCSGALAVLGLFVFSRNTEYIFLEAVL
jgi:hypothetical protein